MEDRPLSLEQGKINMKIDIECSVCGNHMFSIDQENIVGPVGTICETCRTKEEINLGELYIHNKTGNLYEIIGRDIINATNGFEDQRMIMYIREGSEFKGQIFVREEKEFLEKFKAVHNKRYERL